ncbi:MAG TPA: hypothetical protein VK607_02350 [Kofleriaceae bacterium]|nr:hypothetical protein [Kofleriaceae bacterium]
MRCPSCATDNAPDSRFCGGCGARLAASGARVAPTQKIADDARFQPRQLSPAGSAVPVTAPGVAPPRPIPASPFMPHGAPPAQPPLGVGSVAPRPMTAAPVAAAMPRPITAPPAYAGGPGPARPRSSPRPQIAVVDDPSLSLPMPARRPWGLMFVVLFVDLGLAAGGVWMLTQGLR